MSCVGEDGEEPLLCGRYAPNMNGIGTFDPSSESVRGWFDFTDVKSAVSCGPESETAQTCAPLWHDWNAEILLGAATDAAVEPDASMAQPDGGTMPHGDGSVSTDHQASARRSSGCSVMDTSTSALGCETRSAWWAHSAMRATLTLALAGVLLWKRRMRRASPRA
jgi:hypothetical protein